MITDNLVSLKRENTEPILTVKIIEWRKLIDYIGLSIEADPSTVGKDNVYMFHIGNIPIPSSVKFHIASHQMEKLIYLEPLN